MRRRTTIWGAVLALFAGLLTAAYAAGGAQATTLSCTNTQSAVTSPYGCGGLQIAPGYPHGTLDMATTTTADSAPVVAQPDNINGTIAPHEDWTVFPENGSLTSGPGGLGEYVAMQTPFGHVAHFQITGAVANTGGCAFAVGTYTNMTPCPGATFKALSGTYCLSVANFRGFNGKVRWWALLRLCSTNGTFVYGTSTGPGFVSFSFANRWQLWAPVTGDAGLKMVNISLFNRFNSDYDLNITGGAGPGVQLQAYPDNTGGHNNDQWDIIGCTPPITLLSTPYALC
jgi:hypothetical protein